MFVQCDRFIRAHREADRDISIYGQTLNRATWRLAKMNLGVRGIDGTDRAACLGGVAWGYGTRRIVRAELNHAYP